jgi:hypothetical protein
MKRVILFSVLISGCILPAFSQINTSLKIGTTDKNLSFYNYQKPCSLLNSIDFKSQSNSGLDDGNYLLDRFSDKKQILGKDALEPFEKPQSFANMPCVKPEGNFPMRICKPDSTVRYSLLIKEIK